jgi:hypothetical protein
VWLAHVHTPSVQLSSILFTGMLVAMKLANDKHFGLVPTGQMGKCWTEGEGSLPDLLSAHQQ